jgi:hypothetical protein
VSSFQSLKYRTSSKALLITHLFLLYKLAIHWMTINPYNSWCTQYVSEIYNTTVKVCSVHTHSETTQVSVNVDPFTLYLPGMDYEETEAPNKCSYHTHTRPSACVFNTTLFSEKHGWWTETS